jgi:three-Cys-motif partner protein
MSQDRFGSAHTVAKLDALENYLDAYTTALKKRGFTLLYFDAFAGTGDLNVTGAPLLKEVNGAEEFAAGSARRSLRISTPFHRYVFNELRTRKAQELAKLRLEFPHLADRIHITSLDANDALGEFCANLRTSKERAVVFLDPYGSQVAWSSVEKLARTRAVDLWYLFPSGLSVFRQISKFGKTTGEQAASIDRLLGTSDWRHQFVETQQESHLDLLGNERLVQSVAKASVTKITQFVIKRLNGTFEGGALDAWLPLGRGQAHWYSLVFALANPSPGATTLAKKLARAVLRAK